MADFRILLVCLGNICRSPTAEAALRRALEDADLGDRVAIDSAGTGDWHIGDPPDRRMVAAAAERGLELQGMARQITTEDFSDYDLILAMDASNRDDLIALAPDVDSAQKVHLYREFEGGAAGTDVPDPYYGGTDGFRRVVDIVRAGADGVVAHVRERIGA